MLVTGYIEEIIPFSYENNGRMYHKKHIVINYPFYNQINKIVLTANHQLVLPDDFDQPFTFTFEPVTRFSHNKIFTDFYLHAIQSALKVTEEAFLTLVDTKIEAEELVVLKEEEINGRLKKTVALHTVAHKTLHLYYWSDNAFLASMTQNSVLQINCKSLYHKNRWINNMEIWRTVHNDDFLGSIIL